MAAAEQAAILHRTIFRLMHHADRDRDEHRQGGRRIQAPLAARCAASEKCAKKDPPKRVFFLYLAAPEGFEPPNA
jgi:hypothetical protein